MSFTPISVGDRSIQHHHFTMDGGKVFPLTGLDESKLALHYRSSTGVMRVGTGTWLIIDSPNGKADYTPSAADVAVAGTFVLYPVLTLLTGNKAFDEQTQEIRNRP